MIKITDLFDFEVREIGDGNIEILDLCNYPQESQKCYELYKYIELNNIYYSGLEFPIHLKKWSITITPDDDEKIQKYYCIDGLKVVLDDNISKLKDTTTFFKPEIRFPPNAIYPNFILNFYQVVEEGGICVIDDFDMLEVCLVHYEDTNQFTEERIEALSKLINVAELYQIPFLPIELIRFNASGEIEEIEQHSLCKKSCK